MCSIKRSIEQAADRFDKLFKELPVELEYLDDLACAQQDLYFYDASSEAPFSDKLGDITQSLRRLREDAALVEAMIAAYVHPAKRTPNEKRLVESHDLASRRDNEYRFLKPKTPAVDLWFIGAAAACLRKCEYATGQHIPSKDKIIGRMFALMDEPGRTEGSIAKELLRQEKYLRQPVVRLPYCPLDGWYGPDLLP